MIRRISAVMAVGVIAVSCGEVAGFSEGRTTISERPVPPVLWFDGAVPPSDNDQLVEAVVELEGAESPFLEIGFAGDTSFTHGLARRDPLAEVSSLLRLPDVMLVNLETAVAEPSIGSPQNKEFTFRSPPESVQLLNAAGIDGVALANNHALDYGRSALSRTLELLDAGGVGRAGAGATAAEAYAPMVFVRGGTRVAILSYSRILPASWTALPDRSGVASAHSVYVDDTVEAVRAAREVADIVAVMVHWGLELESCPQPYQRDLATSWADAGADLIVGSHPHVLQGVERIGDTWVVYSTGNFAFPSARQASADTALFRFVIHDNTVSLTVDPLRIVGGSPKPADEVSADRILELLSARSFGLQFSGSGKAQVASGVGRC